MACPVFLTIEEIIELEDTLLRTQRAEVEMSRRLGVLVGKLAMSREEFSVANEW